MQAAFYAVPIIYPLQFVVDASETAAKFVVLNPVTQIFQDLRYSLVTEQTLRTSDVVQMPFALIPYLIVVITLVVGTFYFRKKSRFFAEQI